MPRFIKDKSSLVTIISLAIILVSIISYIYITYVSVDKSFYDDKISWYHIHILKYIANGGDIINDPYLWFPIGKDLTRSPILLDVINAYAGNLGPGILTLMMGILLGIEALVLAYIMFRDKLTSSLALALTLLVPATAYWFKYTNYGSYIAMPVGILAIALLALLPKYTTNAKNFWKIFIAGIVIYVVSWFMWSAAWIIPLVLSLYMITLMYSGAIDKRILLASSILFLTTLILAVVDKYFTVYHLFALIFLGTTIIFSYTEYTFVSTITIAFKRNVWRLVSTIFSLATAIILTYIITTFFNPPGLLEPYSKEYNPVVDIFPVVILAPFALVMYLRSRLLTDLKRNSVEVMSIILFLTCIIAAYIEPPLSILATLAISPFIMFALSKVADFIYKEYKGKLRVFALAILTWIIIGILAGGAAGSYNVVSTPPQIYYSGITPAGHGYKVVNESGLATLLNLVEEDSVVIVHWDKAAWVTGLKPVHTLADDHGPDANKRIISLIMISDEETARALIEKYIDTSKYKVYILVSELVSVDKTPLGLVRKAVHIGRAYVAGEGAYGMPEIIYVPFGDIARLFEYVTLSGKKSAEYISLQAPIRSSLQLSLAWSPKAEKTLLVRLVTDAIFQLGYNPVNNLVSNNPLTRTDFPKLKYFKLVKATMTYLDTVHTDMGDYEIRVLVALYEFVPPEETS